jgi:gamma-butyrobetaine dioxygenase
MNPDPRRARPRSSLGIHCTWAPDGGVDQASAPIVDMGEFGPYAGPHRLADAEIDGELVRITWDDAVQAVYHRLWLRDNCACADCRHPQTRERTVKLVDIDEPGRPEVTSDSDGALTCTWADGHVSRFDPNWLRQRRPEADGPAQPTPRLWTSARMADGLPSVDHHAVMNTNDGLRRWLDALSRDGATLVTGGPTQPGEVVRLAERIGWPRETNFGRHFDVQSKPNPNNAAYTAIRLEPHVDLPNWQRPPDFQFLYCLENKADGGESLLVDGFAVAGGLAEEDPEAFETLCTLPVDFRFQDAENDIRYRAPVIGRDADGAVREIRFNNWIRDAQPMDPAAAERFYRGYRRFWELLRDPKYMIRFPLKPGCMMAFDNLRVLHGREEFFPNTGKRHLQGCYVDRDLVDSRLRVLERT